MPKIENLSATPSRHPSAGWGLGPNGASFKTWRLAALDASLRWHDAVFGTLGDVVLETLRGFVASCESLFFTQSHEAAKTGAKNDNILQNRELNQ